MQKEKMNNHASNKTQVRLTSSMCTDMDQKHGTNQHETIMNQAPHAQYNNHETPKLHGPDNMNTEQEKQEKSE